MKTLILLAASIAVASALVPAVSALAACPDAQASFIPQNETDTQHVVTLETVHVRPSAEQRAEQEALNARQRRVVTLDTVHVRPSPEQLAGLSPRQAIALDTVVWTEPRPQPTVTTWALGVGGQWGTDTFEYAPVQEARYRLGKTLMIAGGYLHPVAEF